MICDKTREALAGLFPSAPEPPPDNGGEDTPAVGARGKGLVVRDYRVHGYHLDAQLDPGQLLKAVTILDELSFFLESITGVDWPAAEEMEVVYDFSRYDFDLCRVVLRTRVNRNTPDVPTITGIYAGANWHERETHDFFGIQFVGHPHLVPLLLPEDADFHPLRKDFQA